MFTGIIEAVGTVADVAQLPDGSATLTVDAGPLVADLPQGGSLAVNGVCLTAVPMAGPPRDRSDKQHLASADGLTGNDPAASPPGRFTADVMGETLRLTSLGQLQAGSQVNLERCLSPTGRFDGHIVQGHVDGTATLAAVDDHGSWAVYRFAVPADLAPYLALKGSVAIDGISLTISGVSEPPTTGAANQTPTSHWVEVSLIPATRANTILGTAVVGQTVNIEVDVFAKYAARLAGFAATQPSAPTATEGASA